MCRFIETIKFEDGQFFYLNYHQDRIDRTWKIFFPEKSPIDLKSVLEPIEKPENGLFRCRVIYNSAVQSIEFIEQSIREIKTLQVVHYDEIDYSYKYLDRKLIEKLTKQKQGRDDILIIKNGFVTDTSIGNILFYDGNNWITPTTPLLPGTARARLIKEGIVKEIPITLSDISGFSGFQVVNALIPFHKENFNPIENIQH